MNWEFAAHFSIAGREFRYENFVRHQGFAELSRWILSEVRYTSGQLRIVDDFPSRRTEEEDEPISGIGVVVQCMTSESAARQTG